MILLIDNFDSFTFNLVRYFEELSFEVMVVKNNAISLGDIDRLNPEFIVLSPGPGRPEDAGICLPVVDKFYTSKPILGVCLGHQVIAQYFGAKIIHAKQLIHGKVSAIHHENDVLFEQVVSPFNATRYHSLVVDAKSLSSELLVTASTQTALGEFDEVMAIAHKSYPVFGVQFHPEAALTENGHQILANFIACGLQSLVSTKEIVWS
ncbi:MAG: aminodeoxychorismate/anthranilate synthase component II [Cellvibrionales bacterium]|nr:aminodeoxychorismate/anthranilate synthase component II [Cellvibrionales bacterium]